MIAHNPLQGSEEAALPHPDLDLGKEAYAAQGIRMEDGRQRQPASHKAQHAIPKNAAVLAAPRQRAVPEPPYLESKEPQCRGVHGHSVISDVSTHHRLQPLAQLRNGFVHASLKLGFHLVQLRLQPFAYRLPQHRKPSIAPLLYADMRKAEKVERLRLPFSTPLSLVDRERTELQQARFLGMQFQVELPHSFRKFCPELIGIRFAVKSDHDVVRKSHHDHIAVRALLTPCLDPQVEYIMKIDVCQKRRSTSALGRPFLRPYSLPILQHAGPQPFLDEAHDAPICNPALDDLVFQRRDSERSLPPVGLRDKHPSHRLRSIRSSLQPFGKVLEIPLQLLAIVPPRFTVHTRSGFLLQSEVGHAQRFQVVDVVQERREPQLLILSCCLTYPLQRTRRVVPARCPGRVLLGQVPFGQTSSLHPLRHRLPGVVRRLLRYYRSVRLPRSVRHRRTSLDFPMRPRATADLGELGISRFPCEVPPYVLGVSDRAGLWYTSRYRCTRWGLPLSPTASASRRKFLTRLNTRPARSPVNASTLPLQAAPHDSGPMWVADPLSYDFCIHYTSPV